MTDSSPPCLKSVPGTTLRYYLVAFDKYGQERPWSDGRPASRWAVDELHRGAITDVFIFSHGWMGDVTQAKFQYGDWVGAMAQCQRDLDSMRRVRPGFAPLLIGIHWPSLPLGDETLSAMAASPGAAAAVDQVEKFAERIANTRRARQALQTIVEATQEPPPEQLPDRLDTAFRVLPQEAGLRLQGVAAPPASEGSGFDPKQLYADLSSDWEVQETIPKHGAGGVRNYNLLYLLAILSFWKMKARAQRTGETGGRQLLIALQSAVPQGRQVRFHLMGHSFGCIVVSAALQGAANDRRQLRPVDSLCMVQGALSHWSFCTNVYNTGDLGYFRPLIDRRLVVGPIVTTQSHNDTAVRVLYPYAARFKGQRAMADRNMPMWPEYGAIGCHGIQGPSCNANDLEVEDLDKSYGFKPGQIYNIDCTRVINKMYPISGAHSDISHPEVAHAIWEAAQVSMPVPSPRPPQPGATPLRASFRRRRGR